MNANGPFFSFSFLFASQTDDSLINHLGGGGGCIIGDTQCMDNWIRMKGQPCL